MTLPNADRAIIDGAKLRDYLLAPSHPVGRHKAKVFRALGYSQEQWQQLEADLRDQHLTQEVHSSSASPYGQKYEILAKLVGPAGVDAEIVSVWIIKAGEDAPRFVTAFPGGRT